MGNQRAGLDLGLDDEPVNIEDVAGDIGTKKSHIDQAELEKVANVSGFVSRQPKKTRIRRRSPYTVQTNFKTRVGMKELLQELGSRLEKYDQEVFEMAILALLEKENIPDLLNKYQEIKK